MGALVERAALEEAIRAVKGHQTAAAKRLGVTPAQLAHKLAAEGLMSLCRELRAASRAAALADHEAQRASAAVVAAAVAVKRSAAVSKEQLKDALVAERGCVGKVAERLGVVPGSIYKMIRKHDLLELQTTLAKETAAARHAAAKEKRKQYERERERMRVRNRPVEQVPHRLVGQVLPQSQPAPGLQHAEPAIAPAPRTPAPAPYQRPARPWDGKIKKCPPDPRIAARSFNVDDSERVPSKPKNWTGRRVR
jgi:hypothetical protein